MTDKGLGFIRNINLAWLDAAADASLQYTDMASMRNALDNALTQDIQGLESRRKTIDVLMGIWHKTALVDSQIHAQAIDFLPHIPTDEHIWLHYGLTLLYYPFFRQTAVVIGQFARTGEPMTRQAVKSRLAAEIGHLGSLNRAAERIVASLVDWQILTHQSKGNLYIPHLQAISTSNTEIQSWLLACAISAHPADQLPYTDLLRLPELFPFKFTLNTDSLRRNNKFYVQKQGAWDMVGLSF
jgi:hypothetical protein